MSGSAPATTAGPRPGATRWAQLRQVVFASDDHARDVAALRDAFGLGPGFADPVLDDWNLADETMPVGPDTYLEVVSPTDPAHPLVRWLAKVGGSAGYVLSTQVPDLDGVAARCERLGIGIVADTETDGHAILQLHPKQMGVVLELDAFLPQQGWFWDDLPGAREAHRHTGAAIDDIRAVDIAAPDPSALAALWTEVVGLAGPRQDGPAWIVDFGDRPIRFVPAPGSRTGLVAVDVRAAERAAAGTSVEVCHTQFRLV